MSSVIELNEKGRELVFTSDEIKCVYARVPDLGGDYSAELIASAHEFILTVEKVAHKKMFDAISGLDFSALSGLGTMDECIKKAVEILEERRSLKNAGTSGDV